MTWMSVSELFTSISRQFPQKSAIEWGVHSITYGDLEQQSTEIANRLTTGPGWSEGTVVAILSTTPPDVIRSILAILKAGGAFAPIDPLTPEKRIEQMLSEISPASILFDRINSEMGRGLSQKLAIPSQAICASNLDGIPALPSIHNPNVRPNHNPDAMCYLYFTSGSTGKPKAIAGRLKAIDHFVRWEIESFGIGANSRGSQLAHVGFDAYLRDVFVPLCAGGTVCIPEDRSIIWQPEPFVQWVNSSNLSHLHCVPSMFRTLLDGPISSDHFQNLRTILLAGEPLLPSDVDRWMTVFGDRINIVNLYGPSETTMVKLFHPVTEVDRHARSIPIGKPMDGAAVLVVDDAGKPCAPGVMGEIWIRTPFRTHGYYKHPDLTDEVFIVNPFTNDPHDIVFRTGDYGRLRADGELDFSGRIDRQVKIRGTRIGLNEIEEVLRLCGAVYECSVLACGSESSLSLCAFLVLQAEETLETVTRHLTEWLPTYLVPSEFILLEALPKTSNGKTDLQGLAELYKARNIEEVGEEPFTELHLAIAEIWKEVLNISRVRLQDNFFTLGGHSLAIIQVISRIRHQFDIEISVADMFILPTLDSFTSKVQRTIEIHENELEDDFAHLQFAGASDDNPVQPVTVIGKETI